MLLASMAKLSSRASRNLRQRFNVCLTVGRSRQGLMKGFGPSAIPGFLVFYMPEVTLGPYSFPDA